MQSWTASSPRLECIASWKGIRDACLYLEYFRVVLRVAHRTDMNRTDVNVRGKWRWQFHVSGPIWACINVSPPTPALAVQISKLAACNTLASTWPVARGAFVAHSAALCLWTQEGTIILKRCEALTARQGLASASETS